jgi:hypothetical protein
MTRKLLVKVLDGMLSLNRLFLSFEFVKGIDQELIPLPVK